MKLGGARAEEFLRNPDPRVLAVLVYGPDEGLVGERIHGLARSVVEDPKDPFRVVELEAADLRKDPARVSDEAQALSLTGGRRVVRIRAATDALTKIFEAFLDGSQGGALVLVEGRDLGPRSSLRKLFEKSDKGVSLACYPDDARSLPGVIRGTLEAEGVQVSQDALDYLVGNLGSDRSVTRRELEKLALYVGENGTAELEDVQACVGDSGNSTLDAVVYRAAGGNQRDLDIALGRLLSEGIPPVVVLRAAARHLQRIHLVKGHMTKGLRADEAVKKLRPPVIFKHADAFRAQASRWSSEGLARALAIVTEAELECKTTGLPAEAICTRTLMRIAQAAGR